MGQACYKHSDSGYSSDGKYHLTVRIGADDIPLVADRKMQVNQFKEWILNEKKMSATSSIRLFFYGCVPSLFVVCMDQNTVTIL